MTVTADDGTLDEVARIVGHEVRDTDLLGSTETGILSLVLLDADYDNGTRVIDRLVQRIDHYEFTTPLRISVGAACYPTHGVDPDSLKRPGTVSSGRELAWRCSRIANTPLTLTRRLRLGEPLKWKWRSYVAASRASPRANGPERRGLGEFAEARCPNWRNGRNGKHVNSYCTSAAPEVEP